MSFPKRVVVTNSLCLMFGFWARGHNWSFPAGIAFAAGCVALSLWIWPLERDQS